MLSLSQIVKLRLYIHNSLISSSGYVCTKCGSVGNNKGREM